MRLYEAHLPVTDTQASARFYSEIVGLTVAHRDNTRDITFLWAGPERVSMLGLWGPGTAYGNEFHKSHVAFAIPLSDLLSVGSRLNDLGVITYNFEGERTREPSVIGWMPSAQLYFSDLDGHSVELIALLDQAPDAGFTGSLSAWLKRA